MFDTGVGSAPVVSRPRDARLLRLARECGPGPVALAHLDRIDAAALCEADRVDLLACWEAHEGWLMARRAAALVAVAGAQPSETADELAEESVLMEVGAALRVTPTTAGHRIDSARFLAAHPALVEALSAGRVGYGHVAVLQRELGAASERVIDAVLSEVLPRVDADTPSRLRMRARRSLARLDAEAIQRRIAAAAKDRSCSLDADPDLVGRMTVTGPWQMTAWAFRQFDAWARAEQDRLAAGDRAGSQSGSQSGSDFGSDSGGGDAAAGRPSLSALRADAVVEAARLLALSMGCPGTDRPDTGDGCTPARGRSWSTAIVVCDLPTALGVADEPGFVPGHGPVPASLARELLAQAETWRRFLVQDGALVDAGATRYRPSGRLRELVTARDQSCVFPGCTVPAVLADLDHTQPFDGTNSTPGNLRPLCRRHHRVKTHVRSWRLRSRDGTPEWTSPTGHRYDTPAHPLWETTEYARRDAHRRAALSRAGWRVHPTRAA